MKGMFPNRSESFDLQKGPLGNGYIQRHATLDSINLWDLQLWPVVPNLSEILDGRRDGNQGYLLEFNATGNTNSPVVEHIQVH
ncbi:hypothetical protein CEK25_007813 [Fusarium fujikuroi]|nr:hypothetical protein CEK25_007813 [Fusarium fujikuroi]